MMLFEKPMIVPAAPKRLASAALDVDDYDEEYDNATDIQDTDLFVEADDIRYLIFGEVSTEDDSEEE
ncbi:unnamed protein product [Nezara viridula]|uniref:Uncharacterized protein n=1 Tax=Nezara viridula TaxID=85310 RepID=A0A9P0H2V1_NEZVI|nr:unnamed protein product [Nezara viridula]